MLKEGKIGVSEAISLMTIMIASKVLFTRPQSHVDLLGPAGWYGAIISALTALAGFYVLFLLIKRFQGRNLVSVFEAVFGRWAGSLLLLLFAAWFIFNAGMTTREFVEAVKVYSYPLSPPSFLITFFLLSVITVLYFGFEAIARTASLFAWPLLAAVISIIFLAVPLYNTSNLFPILGHGPGKTILHGLARSSVYAEVVALAVFVTSLQGLSNFKRAGVTAVVVSGLVFSSTLLVYLMVFPYLISAEIPIPLLVITRVIEYGRFFQRFESLFLFAWSVATIMTVAINLYVALSIYCKVFRIDNHRALILPLAVIGFSLAILPPDISSVVFISDSLTENSWAILFGLPLLALLTAVIRGKKGGPAGA
jgi:spore germination protein KB